MLEYNRMTPFLARHKALFPHMMTSLKEVVVWADTNDASYKIWVCIFILRSVYYVLCCCHVSLPDHSGAFGLFDHALLRLLALGHGQVCVWHTSDSSVSWMYGSWTHCLVSVKSPSSSALPALPASLMTNPYAIYPSSPSNLPKWGDGDSTMMDGGRLVPEKWVDYWRTVGNEPEEVIYNPSRGGPGHCVTAH